MAPVTRNTPCLDCIRTINERTHLPTHNFFLTHGSIFQTKTSQGGGKRSVDESGGGLQE